MINTTHSFRDYTNQNLSNLPSNEFSNSIIRGTNFYQEILKEENFELKSIFPDGATNITFDRCNLDNVSVPENSVLIGCTNKRVKVQNDGYDWIIDGNNVPIEPVAKGIFEQEGWSTDPKDIDARSVAGLL